MNQRGKHGMKFRERKANRKISWCPRTEIRAAGKTMKIIEKEVSMNRAGNREKGGVKEAKSREGDTTALHRTACFRLRAEQAEGSILTLA